MQDGTDPLVPVNWDDLKIVLAVGRARSLTKAAALLGIDQSTAGRRLSAAEAALGAVLFARSKTGFAPTEAGEEAIARALEIESRVLRLAESLVNPQGGPAGLVRIASNPWILVRLAGAALPTLLTRHPRLRIHCIGGPQPPGLVGSDPTVGLWFESTPRETEFAVKLGDVPYAVYGPRDADPEGLDWVSFADTDHPHPLPGRVGARQAGDPRTLRLTATDAGVLLASMTAGIGKGLLPCCIGARHPGLVRITAGDPDLIRPLYIHIHPDIMQTQRVQATMAWIRETFSDTFCVDS